MNRPPKKKHPGALVRFGPFTNVPQELIHPVGFDCSQCGGTVRRFGVVMPHLIPRLVFYSCRCGTISVWEDEAQPHGSQHWALNIELLKKSGASLVIFNGNKSRPPPSFAGIN
jgi:hypothetical protein